MKKRIIIIICAAAVLAGCIAAAVYSRIQGHIPENPDGFLGNTAGNLYNGGFFCESDDGYVYFSNPYDSGALYRMFPDETGVEKISSAIVSDINADSKYLYFYQSGSGGGAGLGYLINSYGLYRMAKNNPNDIECLDRVIGEDVCLVANTVYYTSLENSTATLMGIGIDGSGQTALMEADVLPASVQDSTLYYMNSNGRDLHFMSLNLNTGATRQVLDEDIYMPIVENGSVYGIDIHDGYSLVSIDLATGEKSLLDSDRTDFLNLTDNYIYYQTSGDTPQIKRIRQNGADMEVVADGTYSDINATSEYVYFTSYNSDTPVYRTPEAGAVNISVFEAASDAALQEMSQK